MRTKKQNIIENNEITEVRTKEGVINKKTIEKSEKLAPIKPDKDDEFEKVKKIKDKRILDELIILLNDEVVSGKKAAEMIQSYYTNKINKQKYN